MQAPQQRLDFNGGLFGVDHSHTVVVVVWLMRAVVVGGYRTVRISQVDNVGVALLLLVGFLASLWVFALIGARIARASTRLPGSC